MRNTFYTLRAGMPLPVPAFIFLIAGVTFLYHSFNISMHIYNTEPAGNSLKLSASIFGLYIFHAVLLLFISIKLFGSSKHGRTLAQLGSWILILGAVIRLIIIGSYGEIPYYALVFFASFWILFYLKRNDIQTRFAHHKMPAAITFLLLWIILMLFSMYIFMFLNYGLKTPSVINEKLIVENLDPHETYALPFKYNIKIPDSYQIDSIIKEQNGRYAIRFRGPMNSLIILRNSSILEDIEEVMSPLVGQKEKFIHRYFNERFGLVFIMIKRIVEHSASSDYLAFELADELEAYTIIIGEENPGETMYLVKDGEFLGDIHYFSSLNRNIGYLPELLKNTVINNNRLTSPQYAEEAVKKSNLKKHEESARLYAYSLVGNWKNPELHYSLAMEMFQTGNLTGAKKHAIETLKLNSNHKHAQHLLKSLTGKSS